MLSLEQGIELNRPQPCHVRRMRKEDIPQMSRIDREAFPTMWPPVNFQHELDNRLARYIVAFNEMEVVSEPAIPVYDNGVSRLWSRVRQLFAGNQVGVIEGVPVLTDYIMGFIGIWLMADEAHIINIAVREQYRHKGIGELMLIGGIDMTMKLKASMMTLEVRPSNFAARQLYTKYGFNEVGVRHHYYTDNKEDALLMTTGSFFSASYRERFQLLKEAHLKKLGMTNYEMEEASFCNR